MAVRGAAGERVDFMRRFAYLLPVTVICDLIGIPEADRETFRPLAADLVAGLIGERRRAQDALALADAATVQLNDYFTALAGDRRRQPRDDLISVLVQVRDAGDGRLSDAEFLDNLNMLILAGFVTTTNLLGNGLAIMLADPATLAAVRNGGISPAAFAEEALRYEAPVQMALRRAAADTEIGGIPVSADSQLILLIGAGNRDPRRFASPDRFDPGPSRRRVAQLRRRPALPPGRGPGPHESLGGFLAPARPVPRHRRGGRAAPGTRPGLPRLRVPPGADHVSLADRASRAELALNRPRPPTGPGWVTRGRSPGCGPAPAAAVRHQERTVASRYPASARRAATWAWTAASPARTRCATKPRQTEVHSSARPSASTSGSNVPAACQRRTACANWLRSDR